MSTANSSETAFNYWGSTSEEILSRNFPLHKACRDGDVETLSILLLETQHGIYVEDSFYGWTPAHWSAYFGKLPCLMKLLEKGMNCDTATMRLNQTPTHLAAFAGNSHCLKWLLHYGASKDRQDYLGETPAHKGARTGSMECLSLLASHGARLYIRNNNNQTAAHISAECGFSDCASFVECAASRQEQSQCLGVYENQILKESSDISCPSPHDVTTNAVVSGIKPDIYTEFKPESKTMCPKLPNVQNSYCKNDLNGIEFEMEEDVSEEPSVTENPRSLKVFPDIESRTQNCVHQNGDITLNTAVSNNQVPIGGRKRCREDHEERDYKRIKQNHQNMHSSWDIWGNDSDLQCIADESDDQLFNNEECDIDGEDFGYDYNGIPQENINYAKVNASKLIGVNNDTNNLFLKQQQQFPAKCIGLTGHFI